MKIKAFLGAVLIVSANPPLLVGEVYKFDQAASTIGFAVHQFLGTTHGRFTRLEGEIEVDRAHPENSSVTAKIDVGSVNTGIQKRDDHLRSPDFFNVAKFPEIIFKTRSIKQTGSQSGDIFGELTMHGITKPITLHVKLITPLNDMKHTRWAVTTAPIKRSDFNLLFPPGLEAVSGISQTVAVNIDIEARRVQ